MKREELVEKFLSDDNIMNILELADEKNKTYLSFIYDKDSRRFYYNVFTLDNYNETLKTKYQKNILKKFKKYLEKTYRIKKTKMNIDSIYDEPLTSDHELTGIYNKIRWVLKLC